MGLFSRKKKKPTLQNLTRASREPEKKGVKKCQYEKSDVNDPEYWWNFEGHPQFELPFFKAIDPKRVVYDIVHKLKDGEMPLIEIPANILETVRLLDNPEFRYDDVASLIERSPAMAGEFLKVINSSIMSRGVMVHDLRSALPRLGKVKVRSMLYMYSAKMNFQGAPLFNDLVQDIVEHSYAVALVASYLSLRYYPDSDTAFLTGLLHDIGKLAILKAITDLYTLPDQVDFQLSEEVFANIFPKLHERAGIFIAESWNADETVKAAIAHHHDLVIDGSKYKYPDLAEKLTYLTNVSDTITRILGKGRSIREVQLFSEQSACQLEWEHSWSSIEFLQSIPDMLNFKLDRKE